MSVEIKVTRGEEVIEMIELAPGQIEHIEMPPETRLGPLDFEAAENGTDFVLKNPNVKGKDTKYEAGTHASSLTINYKDGKVIKISTGTPSYQK